MSTVIAPSPIRQIARLAVRTTAILLVAGVIVAAATAIGSSPLASSLPATLLPFTQQQHQGPAPAQAQAENAPTRGGQPAQRGQAPGGGAPSTNTNQGLFSGRNAPSLNGLRQEVPYVALFAGLTAIVALALRLLQPRNKRRTPRGFSMAAA